MHARLCMPWLGLPPNTSYTSPYTTGIPITSKSAHFGSRKRGCGYPLLQVREAPMSGHLHMDRHVNHTGFLRGPPRRAYYVVVGIENSRPLFRWHGKSSLGVTNPHIIGHRRSLCACIPKVLSSGVALLFAKTGTAIVVSCWRRTGPCLRPLGTYGGRYVRCVALRCFGCVVFPCFPPLPMVCSVVAFSYRSNC